MSAPRRTVRDRRRRRLGQNFLDPRTAEQLVDQAAFQPGEHVIEVGAGLGAWTHALVRRDVRLTAVEIDPNWSRRLRDRFRGHRLVRVVEADFLSLPLPSKPFRVVGSLPYAKTTEILRHLLDDPASGLQRADIIVQWEVARKRAMSPPSTLLSTTWTPWWEVRLAQRVPAQAFRPVPAVDSGWLTIIRRDPALLPTGMAQAYADFVRHHWPFGNDRHGKGDHQNTGNRAKAGDGGR